METTALYDEIRGTSSVAVDIAKAVNEVDRYLHKSVSGAEPLIRSELYDLREECSEPDWDGFDAAPVSKESFLAARQFLLSLPLGSKLPAVGILPSGNVTLEWHHSRRRSLTMSFAPDGDIHYAALLGAGRQSGTEPFYGEIPATILNLLERIFPC
jgi:hypothetical protein